MLKKGLVIYEPRGRAKEYAPLAVNLYKGCGHGCIYCYAPDISHTTEDDFRSPEPRKRIIERLEKDARIAAMDLGGKGERTLLCFTCDPYQPLDVSCGLTRQAITILHSNGFTVNILTKGGKRAERDFDLLRPGDQFAVTLTLLDDERSLLWEPGAALPAERVESLRKAHKLGIRTWASLEPVIDPKDSLEIIRQTHSFIDLYKVGKMNYHPIATSIDWRRFLHDALAVLKRYGCAYYIKKDLAEYGK